MSNPEELELAKKALLLGYAGCVEWDEDVVDRLKAELAVHGLQLRVVRKKVIEPIRSGGDVVQVKEVREPWKDRRDYWYKVIVPMPELPGAFKYGLFVELELVNFDPELPEIRLVQAHEQKK